MIVSHKCYSIFFRFYRYILGLFSRLILAFLYSLQRGFLSFSFIVLRYGIYNENRFIGGQCKSHFRPAIFYLIGRMGIHLARYRIPTFRLSIDTHTGSECTRFPPLVGYEINITERTASMCPCNIFGHNHITF